MNPTNRILCILLCAAILSNGALAVWQSHVYVVYQFGAEPGNAAIIQASKALPRDIFISPPMMPPKKVK